MPAAFTFAGALLLSGAFVLAGYCRRFTLHIQRRWQAFSAGVAVAYVFVNVMPELKAHGPVVAGSAMGTLLDAEKRIYLWALAGFVAYAGLSRLRFRASPAAILSRGTSLRYWGELAGYSVYALLIGYLLLHREDESLVSLALFVFAMGLHLFMLDTQLVEQFEQTYEPRGRVLLVGCVLAGWLLGIANAFSGSFTSRLFAFVVGGVVVAAAHEELPAEEGSRFWWFVGGAALYATLLMLI